MPIAIRPVEQQDVPAMAAIRAQVWESEDFWAARIALYLNGEHSPQRALASRAAIVAVEDGTVVGFAAGHRTRRLDCDGELQWMNVREDRRRHRIAGRMLVVIAEWFVQQNALKICVNVDPENAAARRLYASYGAYSLNKHWMVWENVQVILSRGDTLRS